MKITNKQIRQIIKEELDYVLNETIPSDPGLGNQPNQFWRAMSDYSEKWLKQNGQMLMSDNELKKYFLNLKGKLSAVVRDDSQVNSENANAALIPINTYYPEIAEELISNAEKTFDRLTIGR